MNHSELLHELARCRALEQEGKQLIDSGEYKKGEKVLKECIRLLQDKRLDVGLAELAFIKIQKDTLVNAFCLTSLAKLRMDEKKDALLSAQKGDAVALKYFGRNGEQRLAAVDMIGRCFRALGKLQEAKEYALLTGEIANVIGPRALVYLRGSIVQLGHVCQCLGDDRGALEHFEKSLSMGDAEDDTGTLCAMEISYSKLKEYQKAVEVSMQLIAKTESLRGPNHPELAVDLLNSSKLYVELKEYGRARELAERASRIHVQCYGRNHPKTKDALSEVTKIALLEQDKSFKGFSDSRLCSNCHKVGKAEIEMSLCSGCRSVRYCSQECQLIHWKADHKDKCKESNQRRLKPETVEEVLEKVMGAKDPTTFKPESTG